MGEFQKIGRRETTHHVQKMANLEMVRMGSVLPDLNINRPSSPQSLAVVRSEINRSPSGNFLSGIGKMLWGGLKTAGRYTAGYIGGLLLFLASKASTVVGTALVAVPGGLASGAVAFSGMAGSIFKKGIFYSTCLSTKLSAAAAKCITFACKDPKVGEKYAMISNDMDKSFAELFGGAGFVSTLYVGCLDAMFRDMQCMINALAEKLKFS